MSVQRKGTSLLRGTFAVLAGSLFEACSGDSGVEPLRPPDVEGVWQWVQASSKATGETLTPTSEGYSARLGLQGRADDPTHGEFEYWLNNDLVTAGRFTTGSDPSHGFHYIVWETAPIDFHDGVQHYLILVGDTLLLKDNTGDRYASKWIKVE